VDQIEFLREKLHKIMESGTKDEILTVSRELDELIYRYMEDKFMNKNK
jgi:hypothetical protein